MKQSKPIDYLAAIEQLRQQKQTERRQIHNPDFSPVNSEKPVDYLAASKVWEKKQAGIYKIHLRTKRNPSHDPEPA